MTILQQIINEAIPILLTAGSAILVYIIKILGEKAVEFLVEKLKGAKIKTKSDDWDMMLKFGKSVWGIVDERFRIDSTIEKTIDNKQKLFADEIKKLIPQITDSEIESIRQAVAGIVNEGRTDIKDTIEEQKENDPTTPAE